VDGTAGRIAAFLSLVVLLTLVAGHGLGLGYFALAADFGLRSLGYPVFSPVAQAAGLLRRALGLAGRKVNAGPKRFAALLGGLFSLGSGLALLSGFKSLGLGLAAILGVCAGLEAFFGFCLACQVYPWMPWYQVRPSHELQTPL
jgi:hypothetical protein